MTDPRRKINRFFGSMLGMAIIVFGLIAVVQRGYQSSKYGQFIDLGPYHSLIGIAMVALGAGVIYLFTIKQG